MPRIADVAYFNHRPGHSELWKSRAICALTAHTEPWYATGRAAQKVRAVGKTICRELCPVREDCLAYALTAKIEHGTWGGLDEAERERLSPSECARVVDMCRMKVYVEVHSSLKKERRMVTVLAKVNFVPALKPGETGEVEDTIARAAIRNGYAELVGNPENYDEWMYQGEELKLVSGKGKSRKTTAKGGPRKSTVTEPAPEPDKSPGTQQVAQTSTLTAENVEKATGMPVEDSDSPEGPAPSGESDTSGDDE